MADKLEHLKQYLATLSDLYASMSVLSWDQQTYMPPGGVEARAEQLATLSGLAHEKATSAELGELLDDLDGAYAAETETGALIRIARRDYEQNTKLPKAFVEQLTRVVSVADPTWATARETNDWSLFAPYLTTLIDMQREAAAYYNPDVHPFDALLEIGEPGLTKDQLQTMYDQLKDGTRDLLEAIRERQDHQQTAPLHGDFPEATQEAFGLRVIKDFGFDLSRGRQDRAVHPFCTNFGMDDVRLTTRYDPTWLSPAFFGTLHESGHGLYEQGISPKLARTPLAGGCSMGLHESQSRLWENLVGRSRPFWEHYYPELQKAFPHLRQVDPETFYRAVNTVEPSLIRVEADELTYNFHTLLRFELELALLDDALSVADLPAAWNAKMEEYLGLRPASDTDGVLQDVHWSNGLFAYFPTYTIGNVLSVQFFDAAVAAHPSIPADMSQGKFDHLLGWLQENIYQHGRMYDPNELVRRATGRTMDVQPYLRYLQTKFGEVYGL